MRYLLPLLLGLGAFSPAAAREQITNLPTLYIETDGGAPVTSKEEYVHCSIAVVSSDAAEATDALPAGIRLRGNSWFFQRDKPPYQIKFESKQHFLNLPAKDKKWVLLSNFYDQSLLRDALAHTLGTMLRFEFAPAFRHVDVVLNGKYAGNYLAIDRVEVGKHRVEVKPEDETQQGNGFLAELDGYAEEEKIWFATPKGMLVSVKYPDEEEITETRLRTITGFIHAFERKLFAQYFDDPELGWRSIADEGNVIDWYLSCEITGNPDSFWQTYIYKKHGEKKLRFGPMWDYDKAFDNDNRIDDAPHQLMRNVGHTSQHRRWIERLAEDEAFLDSVGLRLRELIDNGLEQRLLAAADSMRECIAGSADMTFDAFPDLLRQHPEFRQTCGFSCHADAVDFVKSYISGRLEFLSMALPCPEESGIVGSESAAKLRFDGATLTSDGPIRVFDMRGTQVAAGAGRVDTRALAPGVYVAVSGARSIRFKR